jgi:FkbM family methyltransferase
MVGATGNWYNGLDEPEEMGLLLHLLRPGDVFVDIGANIGSFTVLAASTGDVACVAFEPVPRTFDLLARNVAFNAMTNCVQLRQQGLSDEPDSLRFTTTLDSMNHVLPNSSTGTESAVAVQVVRLDDVDLPETKDSMIFKIDVEGYELSVLKGAANTLRAVEALCVIMETNGSSERYGVSDVELIALMGTYGYQPYSYLPFERRFEPIQASETHINTVFVKDIYKAMRRVEQAPTVKLLNGSL